MKCSLHSLSKTMCTDVKHCCFKLSHYLDTLGLMPLNHTHFFLWKCLGTETYLANYFTAVHMWHSIYPFVLYALCFGILGYKMQKTSVAWINAISGSWLSVLISVPPHPFHIHGVWSQLYQPFKMVSHFECFHANFQVSLASVINGWNYQYISFPILLDSLKCHLHVKNLCWYWVKCVLCQSYCTWWWCKKSYLPILKGCTNQIWRSWLPWWNDIMCIPYIV